MISVTCCISYDLVKCRSPSRTWRWLKEILYFCQNNMPIAACLVDWSLKNVGGRLVMAWDA